MFWFDVVASWSRLAVASASLVVTLSCPCSVEATDAAVAADVVAQPDGLPVSTPFNNCEVIVVMPLDAALDTEPMPMVSLPRLLCGWCWLRG
jgi:hypothetical protein